MKRASLVLTFATLAAVDVLVATARISHRLRAPEAPVLVPLELARPLPATAVERGAPAPRSRARSARASVAERGYRPTLDVRYRAPLDARTIGGWVFEARGEEWIPLAGASVQLLSGRVYGGRATLDRSLSIGRVTTQSDGAFEFPSLAAGAYTVRVDRDGCATRTMFCEISADAQGDARAGMKIVFGRSRVHGTVYDADGLPSAGIGFVLRPRHSDGWCPDAGGTSDEFGCFEVGGLPADQYDLIVGSGQDDRFAWPHQVVRFALDEGQDRRVDAGSVHPPLHWTGTLRRADGTAIRIAGLRLDFERSLADFDGKCTQTIEAQLGASGEFDVWVPPGTWTPRLCGSEDSRELAPHSLSDELSTEDIVVPGIRVRGSVYEQGTRALLGRVGYRGAVWLCRPGDSNVGVLHSALVDEQGRYELDLVEPGEWELSFGPGRVGRQETPLRLTIAAKDAERQVDLELRAP